MFKYPHGDLHGLNLDWLLAEWKKFKDGFVNKFTASSEVTGVLSNPTVNVIYDPNTEIYDFHFGIPEEVKPLTYSVGYQEGSSGTTIPTGSWLNSPPSVAQGNYLWVRSTITYNNGVTYTSYSVSRMGVDGAGSPATQIPLMDGSASIGTSSSFAREDHVHPSDTSRIPTSALSSSNPAMDGTASAGTSTNVSRADHVHPSDTGKVNLNAWVDITAQCSTDSGTINFVRYLKIGNAIMLNVNISGVIFSGSNIWVTLPNTFPGNTNFYAPLATGYAGMECVFRDDGGVGKKLLLQCTTNATLNVIASGVCEAE